MVDLSDGDTVFNLAEEASPLRGARRLRKSELSVVCVLSVYRRYIVYETYTHGSADSCKHSVFKDARRAISNLWYIVWLFSRVMYCFTRNVCVFFT